MTSSRSPWQRLYAQVLDRRRGYWRRRAERLPRPVLSVGNLHWGGTGKTPITAAIAREFALSGIRVAILSRGYGRRSKGPLVVSKGDGAGPLVPVALAGDEPFLLARSLPDVAVLVGERRAEAGRLALREMEVDLFLLDDGFSHVRLQRQADLLVFPGRAPLARAWLPPTGRLREPLEASRHAQAIVLAGDLDVAPDEMVGRLQRALAGSYSGPVFRTHLRTDLSPATSTASEPRGVAPTRPDRTQHRALLVTGIASPERVARTAERAGLRVIEHLAFADHHDYPQRSVERIREIARRAAAPVVTTEKDMVKLEGRLPTDVAVQVLRVRVDLGHELEAWLRSWWHQTREAEAGDRNAQGSN